MATLHGSASRAARHIRLLDLTRACSETFVAEQRSLRAVESSDMSGHRMRILRYVGTTVALVVAAMVAYGSEIQGDSESTVPADEPDAIGALIAPAVQPDDSVGRPTGDVGNRIAIAAHQIETREYVDAANLLDGIIAELEQQTSRYDPSLVVPLTLRGDALSGAAKYEPAIAAYEQARHITRITNGLHSTDQVGIVYREAATQAAMGKFDRANELEDYAYETLQRKYGPFAPGLVPGLFHLAAWYARTGNIFTARGLYERAVQILAKTNGENDPSLIPALRGLADTYRDEKFPPFRIPTADPEHEAGAMTSSAAQVSAQRVIVVNRFAEGGAALSDIVRITRADPNSKPLDRALAELDLADWYLLFDKPAQAIPVYLHARQVMQDQAGMNDEQIAVYFGQPTLLFQPIPINPPAPPLALRTNPADGYVAMGYTVTEDGTVTDVKIIASDPYGLMDVKLQRGMRVARFRPRFEGDSAVASFNQVYRHTFVYYPRATPVAGTAQPAVAPDNGIEGQPPG